MTYTTDISKLYSLMEANPESYKEIVNNEHQLKMAKRNWPVIKAMASSPGEIPPVLVGEKFDTDIDGKRVKDLVNEQVIKKTMQASTPKKMRVVASSMPGVDDDFQASSPIVDSDVTVTTVNNLNRVEIPKQHARETFKIPTQAKPPNEGQKLASLFSRLEGGYRSDGQHANLLKLRRV